MNELWFIVFFIICIICATANNMWDASEKRAYLSACQAPPIECAKAWEAKQ